MSAKDVARRFLDDGSGGDGVWDMTVIDECFSPDYWSHTWQGDLVVHRSRWRGRHVGELFGVAPTGRLVTVDHVEMWRVADGRIVEHWGGLGAGGRLWRALTVEGGGVADEDVAPPESLVGKDELDEDDEMELAGADLDD